MSELCPNLWVNVTLSLGIVFIAITYNIGEVIKMYGNYYNPYGATQQMQQRLANLQQQQLA